MRKILLATAALLAISTAAHATVDSETVQVNSSAGQAATVSINHATVGVNLTGGASAVGNTLAVTSSALPSGNSSATRRDGSDARVAAKQVNTFSTESATTDIQHSAIGGKLDVTSAAIGNDILVQTQANFDPGFHQGLTGGVALLTSVGMNDGSTGIQSNDHGTQLASVNLYDVDVSGGGKGTSAAIGNNLSFEAGLNGTAAFSQDNTWGVQTASTSVDGSSFLGANNNAFAAQAIGNYGSLTAGSADAAGLQTSYASPQTASLTFTSSVVQGNLSASALSAGNVINVSTPSYPNPVSVGQ